MEVKVTRFEQRLNVGPEEELIIQDYTYHTGMQEGADSCALNCDVKVQEDEELWGTGVRKHYQLNFGKTALERGVT